MENTTQIIDDILTGDPTQWGKYASCKGKPSEWWFAEKYNTAEGKDFTKKAKQICSLCIVRSQCLNLAEKTDEAFGIWGGLTPSERGYRRMTKTR